MNPFRSDLSRFCMKHLESLPLTSPFEELDEYWRSLHALVGDDKTSGQKSATSTPPRAGLMKYCSCGGMEPLCAKWQSP